LFLFRVGEACDVEDYDEYRAIVLNILKMKPTKPISVVVELLQIQKHCKVSGDVSLPAKQYNHLSLPRKKQEAMRVPKIVGVMKVMTMK
jgi:hypothetical protein